MKNESKAAGGKARALALSPEQRKDIAKKAACARWKDKPKVQKIIPLKIKGIFKQKDLKVVISLSDTNIDYCQVDVVENEKVIHSFDEQPIKEAKACIKGYIAALQGLGIEVSLTEVNEAEKSFMGC